MFPNLISGSVSYEPNLPLPSKVYCIVGIFWLIIIKNFWQIIRYNSYQMKITLNAITFIKNLQRHFMLQYFYAMAPICIILAARLDFGWI